MLLRFFRRLASSTITGSVSFALMVSVTILSVVFPHTMGWFLDGLTYIGDILLALFDAVVTASGSSWLRVFYDIFETKVDMTHFLLSIITVLISARIVGVPINRILGGVRTTQQRMIISFTGVMASLILVLFVLSLMSSAPDTYHTIFTFTKWIWKSTITFLLAHFSDSDTVRTLVNFGRQGGAHHALMFLCHVVGMFFVNVALGNLFDKLAKRKVATSNVS